MARLTADLARSRRMRVGDSISREEYDKISTGKDEAQAALASAKAAARRAELDLEFTKVAAPIDGRISRTNITKGNLVTQDQTLLTTIRTIDPIYAAFDVDERTVLQVQKKMREGKFKSYREADFPSTSDADRGGPVPAPGQHRLRGQHARPKHGHAARPGELPQQGPRLAAWDVGARPPPTRRHPQGAGGGGAGAGQ